MSRESDLARRSAEIRKFFRSTTADKATVSQYLHDAELEMALYQVEINRLRTAIHAIERKHDRMKRNAELYKSLLSPIHAVPSEILSIIFAFSCERNILSGSALPSALQLSMVCGRWRDIVFSTPRLWASVEIDFGAWTKGLDVLTQLSELFLTRSQTSSLRFALTLPDDNYMYDGSQPRGGRILATLRSIIGQCERWEQFSLTTLPQHFPSTIFESIRGRVSLLKSLHLLKKGSGRNRWSQLFSYFSTCPALHTLYISPEPNPPRVDQVSLPWSQVKTLRLSIAYNSAAFPLLSCCTAVEQLELDDVGGWASGSNDYTNHLVQHRIRTLDVMKAGAQCEVDGAFKHTTLTGISSLRIWGHWAHLRAGWSTWDNTFLGAFLNRSSCTIAFLHLVTSMHLTLVYLT
ncbi:hypothetical protein PM082_009033 [Marasmius tenuissimus]|nr:hypothetical protein PM082_009033 [Marasmius tenuissimus]